jgi:hypothetical protein
VEPPVGTEAGAVFAKVIEFKPKPVKPIWVVIPVVGFRE